MTARRKSPDGTHLLTPKEEAFCLKYVELNDGSAAYRASYNVKRSSNETIARHVKRALKKPHIKARIEELRAKVLKRHEITVDRVLRELGRVAFFDIRCIFTDDGNLKGPHDLDDDTAAVVAGLEVEELWEGRGEDREQIGRLHKVKLADKLRALESLARHLGMFAGKGDTPAENNTTFIYLPSNGRETK
jgi:phage terminase small subunit